MTPAANPADALRACVTRLGALGPLAVAVSGGVDSVTLMAFVHEVLGPVPASSAAPARVAAFHAVSPAVPPSATERVQELARTRGWDLELIDAGETRSEEYLANPLDRCRVCKSHLYDAMHAATASRPDAVLLSGTNTDDLGDFRPGLEAARLRKVQHPFVEAGMDKAAVRALARALGLHGVAELPAQPCLASRVETGTRISAALLAMVHAVEEHARAAVGALEVVRCRVRAGGVVIELAAPTLAALDAPAQERLRHEVEGIVARAGFTHNVSLAPYRMGSAFLHIV